MTTLPKNLIREFASITNDKKPKTTEEYVYGTVSIQNERPYVRLDGASIDTPAETTVDFKDGDKVMCLWKDRILTIVGNVTNNAVTFQSLTDPDSKTVINGGLIKTGRVESMNGDFYVDLDTGETVLRNAYLYGEIVAANGRIGGLNVTPTGRKIIFKHTAGKVNVNKYAYVGVKNYLKNYPDYPNIRLVFSDIRNNSTTPVTLAIRDSNNVVLAMDTIPPGNNGSEIIRDLYTTDDISYIFEADNYDGTLSCNTTVYGFGTRIEGSLDVDNLYVSKSWKSENEKLYSRWTEVSPLERKQIGNHVYIRGKVRKTRDIMSDDQIADFSYLVPSGSVNDEIAHNPSQTEYRIVPCASDAMAKIHLDTEGGLYVDWVCQFSDTGVSKVTTCPDWIDLTMDYWVD